MTAVFSAQNRDSSSLTVGTAEQCCQQVLSSFNPISLSQYQCCIKHHIVRKLGKEKKKKVFFPYTSSSSTREKAGSRVYVTCREQ